MFLQEIVNDYALGLELADKKYPQAFNQRTKESYQQGIGPHSEADTSFLVYQALSEIYLDKYRDRVHFNISYVSNKRQKCDLCIGEKDAWNGLSKLKCFALWGIMEKLMITF
ncbi:hypothetical protein SAMN02799630_06083 [Paenibacillus sp. UNCCL117]|uniref:hypothetical protein n=1 Tax=unclassified Paenibacillus TaxID=185978 RepID=UPI000881DC46|nr:MULTISPECIES: hypothetical protein [unclassified Paenibacillus]SDE68150.1 hypothetical protein SAMN04488602_1421 [Paenibacillus sp. cl123]SFW70918.1 hypothetical protein SAMN02799630_06083 [Paenibacillus sp. UNCCL117]